MGPYKTLYEGSGDEPSHHSSQTPASACAHRHFSKEGEKYYDYAVDFERSLEDVPKYLALMRAWLRLSELGWVKHERKDDGRLCWNMTKSGIENLEDGTMAELLSGERYGKN